MGPAEALSYVHIPPVLMLASSLYGGMVLLRLTDPIAACSRPPAGRLHVLFPVPLKVFGSLLR